MPLSDNNNIDILEEYKKENERLRKKITENIIPIKDQTIYYIALCSSLLTIIILLIMATFYGS